MKAENALLTGLTTFVATFLASRGTHSAVHEFVATVAMILEAMLVVCGGLSLAGLIPTRITRIWRRVVVVLCFAVAACWLAVFVTDSARQKVLDLFRALLSCF